MSLPVEKVVEAVTREIMLSKQPRPAPTEKEMVAQRADVKAAKLTRKKENKRARKEHAKAVQERADRAEEVAFTTALPVIE